MQNLVIRKLTEVVNGRVVWTDKSKSWLKNDPDLVLSMVKRGLMESNFYLDPSYDQEKHLTPVEIFLMPSSWRKKGKDGKYFNIGVDFFDDNTFNIMYDIDENWVYLDGCEVDPLNFWDDIYECFEVRLSCKLNSFYRSEGI